MDLVNSLDKFKIELTGSIIFLISLFLTFSFHNSDNFLILYSIISLLILALLRHYKEIRTKYLLTYLFSLNLLIYFETINIMVILSYFLISYFPEIKMKSSPLHPGPFLWNKSKDIFFIKDLNLKYNSVNEAWVKSTNISKEEAKGKSDFDLFDKDLATDFRKSDEEAIEIGSSSTIIEVPSDGEIYYHMSIKQAIKDSEGKVIGLFGLRRDVTDQQIVKRTLEEKNVIVEQLLKFSPNPIFIKNLDLTYTLVNEAYTNIHNKPLDEIIGKSDYELFDSETAEKFRLYDKQVIENKKVVIREIVTELAGGSQHSIVTKGPIIDKDGNVTGVIGIAHDITEHKNMEEELLRTQRMESIGILAGGIAHDLNNILTGVSGYASLLDATLENNESLEFVKQIISANERATNLIGKLLIFSSKQVEKVVSIDLNSLIMEIYELLSASMRKSISFTFDLGATSNIDADQSQLNQVLLNLMVNSIDAIESKGDIHIKTFNQFISKPDEYKFHPNKVKAGEFVVFSIRDSGIGIVEEDMNRIFEPFFTTKNDLLVKGTGLGLSIVYGVVNDMGGIISVESEINKGTQFEIMFPAGFMNGDQEIISPQEIRTGSGKILVIDDEEPIIDLLENMLNRLGYVVLHSTRGRQGIELFEKNSSNIKCVILDLLMPEMDGVEVFEELKKIKPEIKVILSSGFGGGIVMEDLLHIGFNDFLSKPYTLKDLSELLNKVLD